MRSYLRTLCALALMLGVLGMGRAMAASTDNLQMEVHVTIVGTHDVVWAAGSGSVVALVGGPIIAGPNDTGGTNPPNTDTFATGSNSTGALDLVRWEINTPLLGQIRATHDAAPAGSDAAVDFHLDNVGNKKVNVTAVVPNNAAAEDSVAAPNHWTMVNAAPTTSQFRLRIQATDSGANLAPDPLSAIGAPATLPTSAYADLAPLGTVRTLVTDWKRFHNHLEIDLEYSTPTDVNLNTEFDVDHVTTINIVTTAN